MNTVSENVRIATTRFGEVEVAPEDQLVFPEGLLGFAEYKRYVMLEDKDSPPFMWLQSLEEPDLAFVTIDPLLLVPDYRVEIKAADVSLLELGELSQARVVAIVVLRERLEDCTVNLQGPVVINPQSRIGKQIVLLGDQYNLRHPILGSPPEPEPVAE